MYSISKKYKTTVQELIDLNNLENNTLSIGQKLKVPSIDEEIYIVQKGDTLWSISKKYNVSVNSIKEKNNLTDNMLSINQQLIIP
ncbi:MAG: LysM peptidoglycan-binding domain-containing protein [Bacilli bacterium]|nr:LysM peptidoglycan-binding domain-containing protein [Bacilli bacterium]